MNKPQDLFLKNTSCVNVRLESLKMRICCFYLCICVHSFYNVQVSLQNVAKKYFRRRDRIPTGRGDILIAILRLAYVCRSSKLRKRHFAPSYMKVNIDVVASVVPYSKSSAHYASTSLLVADPSLCHGRQPRRGVVIFDAKESRGKENKKTKRLKRNCQQKLLLQADK